MTKIAFLLLTFLPLLTCGQETKLITDKKNNEIYSVLKFDKSKKHGIYKKFNFDGSVKIIGNYKFGVQDSIWEFHNYKGELQQKFDFTERRLLYYKLNDKTKDDKYRIYNGNNIQEPTTLERPPIYIGSDAVMFESIFKSLKYPKEAMESGTSGKVLISFKINQKGETSDFKVKSGIGHGCDEEALRVVKNIPPNWLPGLLSGKPVEVEYILPISFQVTDI